MRKWLAMGKQDFIKAALPFYRKLRNVGYGTLEPFDALFRRIIRMEKYPPLRLRRHASCLGSMDGAGSEFVAYLQLLLRLSYDHRLWDIGCGCGLLELALESKGWRGELIGTDIHKPSIQWAASNISTRIPSFRFVHADIFNENFWPRGRLTSVDWFAQFRESDFDIVVAKSLFTHILPEDLELYLREISQRLTKGGKALLTFFLYKGQPASFGELQFIKPDSNSVYAVRRLASPTSAVAYEEAFVLDALARNSLELKEPVLYGSWSGRKDALSYQDVIILTKL